MEWISVKEKLPKNRTAVLCIIRYKNPDKWFTYALLDYNEGEWEYFSGYKENFNSYYQVTHWMSMPEPPKED